MHENLLFWYKIKKNSGEGHSRPQTLPPVGRGTPTHSPLLTPLGASIIAPLALDLWRQQTEILATPLTVSTVSDWQLGLINVCKELISL